MKADSSDEEPEPQFVFQFEDMMEDLHHKQAGTLPVLKPYRTAKYKKIKVGYDKLDFQLKPLWRILFRRQKDKQRPIDEQIKLKEVLPFKERKSESMPECNKLFKKKELFYRCFDCGKNPSAVICAECFQQSNHRGHRFSQHVSNGGGNCDCGNPQSIKQQSFCKRHTGKEGTPKITQPLRKQFHKYMDQIYQWFLILYAKEQKDSLMLMSSLLLYLDELNEGSLDYNVLTYEMLMKNHENEKDKTRLGYLLQLGSKNVDTNFSKWATQLFLKMFSLYEFKQKLAEHYIIYYNKTKAFELTSYNSLFIQIFSNTEIVKYVIHKLNVSLNPKQRESYGISQYNSSLLFMNTMDTETAKIFFRPIIDSGGVDYGLMKVIQQKVENGRDTISDIYKDKQQQQDKYYMVIKAIAKLFQNEPQAIAQEMRNQLAMAQKYTNKKNKFIIPHHRCLALYILVYFKCDLTKIDPDKVMELLKLNRQKFISTIQSMLASYLCCIREFALSLAHREYDSYEFDDYIPLYVAKGKSSKVFTLDSLGLRVFGIILNKMNQIGVYNEVLQYIFSEQFKDVSRQEEWNRREIESIQRRMAEQREMMRRHYKERGNEMHHGRFEEQMDHIYQDRFFRHNFGSRGGQKNQNISQIIKQTQQKITRANGIFFAEWVHYFFFIIQSAFLERPEIIVGNDCHIDTPIVSQMNQRQLAQIFINTNQLTVDEVDAVIPIWFGKQMSTDEVLRVAEFDKIRKIYTIKANVTGTPICKDLLHSFIDNDKYIKYTSKGIEYNDKNRVLRSVLVSDQIIDLVMDKLIEYFKAKISQKQLTFIGYLAQLAKLLGFVIGRKQQRSQKLKEKVLQLATEFNVYEKVKLIFEQSAESFQTNEKQDQKKRTQELRRRQKQKLKALTQQQSENIKKILQMKQEKMDVQSSSDGECIVCRGKDELFYMGLYGESSFIFNTLKLNGTYPFFQCCFHQIHYECFLYFIKEAEQAACPFCRSVSNILLPTEQVLNNDNLFKLLNQRLEVISPIDSRSKQVQDLTPYLTKSFIHLYFIFVLDRKQMNQKKIRLYHIVLNIIRKRYLLLSNDQKQKFDIYLKKSHEIYSFQKKNYHIDQFIALVNMFVLKAIKRQSIDNKCLEMIPTLCPNLPAQDIEKCLKLTANLFDISYVNKVLPKLSAESPSLSKVVNFYQPPNAIKQLLQIRAVEESACKSGHHAVVCIICGWKGCGNCEGVIAHTADLHCSHSIYFNFVTGGMLYIANENRFNLPCLYISEKTGKPWTPKSKDDEYQLDTLTYNELIQSLVEENVAEFMIKKLKEVQVPLLF